MVNENILKPIQKQDTHRIFKDLFVIFWCLLLSRLWTQISELWRLKLFFQLMIPRLNLYQPKLVLFWLLPIFWYFRAILQVITNWKANICTSCRKVTFTGFHLSYPVYWLISLFLVYCCALFLGPFIIFPTSKVWHFLPCLMF